MKMINPFYKIILGLGLISHQACTQTEKLTMYKDDKFTLEYPSIWKMTNENGILNFMPNENYGAVTVSRESGIDFPLEKTREFVLEMNEIKDNPENVKMTNNDGIAKFYYEHFDNNLKWVTIAFRKNSDFYLITINCKTDMWEANKATFFQVTDSFHIKN
ncbi:hypothetical protein EGI24_03745 [Lacihabitans sp. CS3-21]|nr:hypothetical protein [Lacihabitans sp. CS3-21]